MATWYSWNSDSGTSCATTSTWGGWCSYDNYQTSAASSGMVWVRWSTETASTTTTDNTWHTWQDGIVYQPIQERTEEQRRRDEEERIRMEELAKEKESQRKIAEEKALQLLLENLTENQAEIFKMTGAIPIESPSGRKYKINKGTSRNIEEVDEKGTRKAHLCFHPCDYAIPVHDVMLAQKLMLEVCEEDARKIANFS